ncbi:MAG: aspartate aminotransferase family protein, partial [Gaiellaceae bacterium]
MRREEFEPALELAAREAVRYLAEVDERPVRSQRVEEALEAFGGPLPEEGDGALAALAELADEGFEGAVHSAGPRFFHFVTGGVTPAALGADWLASTIDQMAGVWVAGPSAAR